MIAGKRLKLKIELNLKILQKMKDSRQIHASVGYLWKKNLKSPPEFLIFYCVILMFNFDPTLESFLWVIAIGLTIVIVDVFFETEILSAGALLGISIYFSLLFDVDWKWRVLNALVCWLVVTALFYAVWKRFVTPLIRRGFTSGIKESIHSAVGAVGEFRLIDGKAFVYWNGDLWPVDLDGGRAQSAGADGQFKDRDKVTIQSSENGIFLLSPITERSATSPDPTS
jgi:hypothetical protein